MQLILCYQIKKLVFSKFLKNHKVSSVTEFQFSNPRYKDFPMLLAKFNVTVAKFN